MGIELKKTTKEDLETILKFEKEAASKVFHAMTTAQ